MKKSTQKKIPVETGLLPQDALNLEREVNRRAYELWEVAGGGHGDDLQHWLAAERELQARRQSNKPE